MRLLTATALLAVVLGAAAGPPDRAAALAAWDAFRADPLERLDQTQPFLDFISGSGEIHIVLNEGLLAWMYEPIDPKFKAVLYAAYLGANMAAQLERGDTGSDNLAAIAGTLDAYAAVREAHAEFSIPLLDGLTGARAEGRLAEAVTAITGANAAP